MLRTKEFTCRFVAILFIFVLLVAGLGGCGSLSTNNKSKNGTYSIEVSLVGGTGKARIESPTTLTIEGDSMTARIVWSSSHYDYMVVDDTRYTPLEGEETSIFEIPVEALDEDLEVVADTTAMSVPHEITYTLHFDSSTMKAADEKNNSICTCSCLNFNRLSIRRQRYIKRTDILHQSGRKRTFQY